MKGLVAASSHNDRHVRLTVHADDQGRLWYVVRRVNFRGYGLKARRKDMHKTRNLLDALRAYFKQVRCLRKANGEAPPVKYALYKILRMKKLRCD